MRGLTKNSRTRAALFIALAYSVCFLAPSVALAFVVPSSPAAHHVQQIGLKDSSGYDGAGHAHANGMTHHHESGVPCKTSDKSGKTGTENCCGLFCMFALAHDYSLTFDKSAPTSPALQAVADGLNGWGPGPLHEPPIV